MLALEVNTGEEEENGVKGSGGLNWNSSIFPVFTCNHHMPTRAYIVCEGQRPEKELYFTFQETK